MKTVYYTTLLIISTILFASCSNNARSSYERVYAESQREFNSVMSTGQPAIIDKQSVRDACCGDATTGLRDFKLPESKEPLPIVVTPIKPVEKVKEPETVDRGNVEYRYGKLTPTFGTEKLYRYNAVIVTLSVPSNVDGLKPKLQKDKLPFSIALNDRGWYYFVVASSDDEAYVLQRRNEVVAEYTTKYTAKQLRQKYGMPFVDAWIQVNE